MYARLLPRRASTAACASVRSIVGVTGLARSGGGEASAVASTSRRALLQTRDTAGLTTRRHSTTFFLGGDGILPSPIFGDRRLSSPSFEAARFLSTSSREGTKAEPGEAEREEAANGDGEGDQHDGQLDEATMLRQELAKAEEQLKDNQEKALYLAAEMENVRAIAKRDAESARLYAIQKFAKQLLDVADNMERAVSSGSQEGQGAGGDSAHEQLLLGVKMTSEELQKVFRSQGLVKFGESGDKFDPHLHDAMFEYNDPAQEPGTVGQVLKSGYTLHGRVVRAAQVRRGASEQQWADWLKVPFEHACLAWDMSTIRRLLEAGVNGPYDRPRDPRFRRHTLLHLASACGNTEVVNILLTWGSAPDVACREPGEKAYTPLHRAALGGHSEVARVLIKAGADKNARTGGSGASPLHLSARRGHEECVRILLLTGADKDARRALDGATPLHQAAFFGQMGAVRELLEAVADPNAQDAEGCTPVFLSAQEGHEEVVINLLQNGASPDICREDGWSPLHAAARFGHTSTVMALLREGRADFEAPTGDHGSTPLHVAAISGFDEVVSVLMDLGSDLEALDSGGWTPLHCACAAARASCVNALVQRGADPSALTPDGQRPSSLIATDLAEGDEPNEETNQMIMKMLRVPRAESEARRRRQAAKHATNSRPPPPYNNRPPPAYGPEVVGGVVFDSGGSGSGTGSVSGSYSGEGSRQHLRSPREAKQLGGGVVSGTKDARRGGYGAPNVHVSSVNHDNDSPMVDTRGPSPGRGTMVPSPRGAVVGGFKRQTSRTGSDRSHGQTQAKPLSYTFGSREPSSREERPAETAAEWFAERRQEGAGGSVEGEDGRLYGYNPAVDKPPPAQDNRISTGGVVAYPLRRPGGGGIGNSGGHNRGENNIGSIGKDKAGGGSNGSGDRVGNGNGNGNGGSGGTSPPGGVSARGLTAKKPRSPPEAKKNQSERRSGPVFGPRTLARSRSATDFGSAKKGAGTTVLKQKPRSRSPSNAISLASGPKAEESRPHLPATEAAVKRILARQQQQQQQEQQRMRAKSPEIGATESGAVGPAQSEDEGDRNAEDVAVAVAAESAGGKQNSAARPVRAGGGGVSYEKGERSVGGRSGKEEGLPRLLTRPSASLRVAAAAAVGGGGNGGPEGVDRGDDGGRNNGGGNGDRNVEEFGGGQGGEGNRQIFQHNCRRQYHDGRRSSAGRVSGAFDSGISVIDVGGIALGGGEDNAGVGSGASGSGGENGVENGSGIGGEGASGDGSGSGGGIESGGGSGSGSGGGSGGEIAAGSGIGGEILGGVGSGSGGGDSGVGSGVESGGESRGGVDSGVGIGAFSSGRTDDGVGGTPPGTTVTIETDDLGNNGGSSGSSRVSMEATKGIVARRLAAFDPFSFSQEDASSGRQGSKDKPYRTRY